MNSHWSYAWLVCRSLYELVRYDVLYAVCGFGRIQRGLGTRRARTVPDESDRVQAICDAVLLARCLYWKPVLCLQQSACTTRLLNAYGVDARLRIGYRPSPFFSHAWVEVEGRVVNDSPTYQQRLRIIPHDPAVSSRAVEEPRMDASLSADVDMAGVSPR